MDQASRLDDDDDSIGGLGINVDDSERALVRDLLVPLMILILSLSLSLLLLIS